MFEEKSKNIEFKTYPNRKTLIRQIKFNADLAQTVNMVIEVFKNDKSSNGLKMDSNVLIQIALKHYFDYLNSLNDEDKAVQKLKEDIVNGF